MATETSLLAPLDPLTLALLTSQCPRKASHRSEVLCWLDRKFCSAFVPNEEGRKREAMAHVTG